MLAFLSFLCPLPFGLSFHPLLPSFPPFLAFPYLSLPFLAFPCLSFPFQVPYPVPLYSHFLRYSTYRYLPILLPTPHNTLYHPSSTSNSKDNGKKIAACIRNKKKKRKKPAKTKTKRFRIVMIMKRVSIRMHPMVFIVVHSGALGGQKAPEVVVNNYLTTTFFASEIM